MRLFDWLKKPFTPSKRIIHRSEHGINPDAIHPKAQSVITQLHAHGHKAYLVGGAIRDLLIGRPPKDFDIATDAPPETVQRIFKRARLIGRRFKIVHVYMGRDIIEVTTFRSDNEDALIDEHGRILDDNSYGTQAQDAKRRDFTINALYYDVNTASIIDYFNGVKDTKKRRLRLIGAPESRFREDPVRILRALRFMAYLQGRLDTVAAQAIRQCTPLLSNVPKARLYDEIMKLLQSGFAMPTITHWVHFGIAKLLFPEFVGIVNGNNEIGRLGMCSCDERVRDKVHISKSLALAAIYWPQVCHAWQNLPSQAPWPEIHQALVDVVNQPRTIVLPKRILADMIEIWGLQKKFDSHRLHPKKARVLLAHPQIRLAMHFFEFRAQADPELTDLLSWWQTLINGDSAVREQLLHAIVITASTGKRKRRRRKRRPAVNKEENTSTIATL